MPTVTTNGIETYYERRGDGPPLVFVHGGGGDCQLWKRQVEALSDEYDVITYDLRGHGRTGGSDLPRYTMDLYADDLHALIEALELDAPHLCGLSLGGMTALTYAARYSDELRSLMIAGTVTPELQTVKERVIRQVVQPTTATVTTTIGRDRTSAGLRWIAKRLGEDPEDMESELEQLRDEEVEMSDSEYQKMMGAAADYNQLPVILENISVPTLVLYGEEEVFIEAHLPSYQRRIADVQTREIPNAGHNSNIENPDGFTEAVRDFLAAQ